MRVLEHRVPPPVVALAIAGLMWAVSELPPALPLPAALRVILVTVIGLAGITFDALGMLAFHRARTTLNPLQPQQASTLVTDGVFRLTRNPMYVGMTLVLTAWAVHLSALWPFAGPVAFMLYIQRFQIAPEERAMRERFGAQYEAYAARVRRWL